VALAEALERRKKSVTFIALHQPRGWESIPVRACGTANVAYRWQSLADIALDQVFSLPLPIDCSDRKLFALESMHDLRYSPSRQYQLAIDNERIGVPEKQGPAPDITY
jgi:hypothetical protein